MENNIFTPQTRESEEQNPISKENEILHGDLMYTLDKILFWIRIIGFYFLVKIVITIAIIVTILITYKNIIYMIYNMFH